MGSKRDQKGKVKPGSVLQGAMAVCLTCSMVPTAAFAEGTEDTGEQEALTEPLSSPEILLADEPEPELESESELSEAEPAVCSSDEALISPQADSELLIDKTDSGVHYTLDADGLFQAVLADGVESAEIPMYLFLMDRDFGSCGNDIKEVIIGKGVTAIGDYAFYQCSAIEKITLPESLVSIGQSAFSDAYYLKTVVVPASLQAWWESVRATAIPSWITPEVVTPTDPDPSGPEPAPDPNPEPEPDPTPGGPSEPEVVYRLDKTVNGIRYTIADDVLTVRPAEGSGVTVLPTYACMSTSWGAPLYGEDTSGVTKIVIGEGITEIGRRAFNGYADVTEISFPSTLTTIGEGAFRQCTGLVDIDIPGTVKEIGSTAFELCTGITTLTLHDGLETIGSSAFMSASGLTEVYLPASVTSYASNSFSSKTNVITVYDLKYQDATSIEMDGVTYTIDRANKTLMLSGNGSVPNNLFYLGTSTSNTWITDEDTKAKVKAIVSWASDFDAVSIGQDIASIGTLAFCNYSSSIAINVTKVIVEAKNVEVSARAFGSRVLEEVEYSGTDQAVFSVANYTALKKVTLPSGLTAIPDGFASGCTSLTEVDIPESVTTIGESAFQGCTGITEVAFSEGLETIGTSAYVGTSLTKAVLPASVTMWEGAFDEGVEVTQLKAEPKYDVDAVYEGVRYRLLDGVLTAELEEGVESGSIPENLCYASWNASPVPELRDKMAQITKIVIGEGIVSIGNQAFYCFGSGNVTEVILGSSVETIGDSAFYNCSKLTALTLPDGLKTIGAKAFYDCSALTALDVPASVQSIGGSAFYNAASLVDLTFHEGIQTIPNYAFWKAGSLTTVQVPDDTTVGTYAFPSSVQVVRFSQVDAKSVTLNGLTYSIEDDASTLVITGCGAVPARLFYDTSLYPVTDPTIGVIRSWAPNITHIIVGEDVTSVGTYAFRPGGSVTMPLTKLTIEGSLPEQQQTSEASPVYSVTTLEEIEYLADDANIIVLNTNHGLKRITLPEHLTVIPDKFLYMCTANVDFVLPASVEQVGEYAFQQSKWSNAGQPLDLAQCSVIKKQAFYGCGITGAPVFSEALETIGSLAFNGASITGTLAIPAGEIGDNAFQSCTRLSGVQFGAGVTSIGSNAFYGCTGLSGNISFPEGLTSIGSRAFYQCSGLTAEGGVLVIPASTTLVAAYGLRDLSGITKVKLLGPITTYYDTSFPAGAEIEGEVIPNAFVSNGGSYLAEFDESTGMLSISGIEGYEAPDGAPLLAADLSWANIVGGSGKSIKDVQEIRLDGLTVSDDFLFQLASPLICTSVAAGTYVRGSLNPANVDVKPCDLALKRIVIGPSVQSIGARAFVGKAPASLDDPVFVADYNFSTIEEIVVEGDENGQSALSAIGAQAFGRLTGLTHVDLSKAAATEFTMAPFFGCTRLTFEHVELPANMEVLGALSLDGITMADPSKPLDLSALPLQRFSLAAFDVESKMTSLRLPDSLASIDLGDACQVRDVAVVGVKTTENAPIYQPLAEHVAKAGGALTWAKYRVTFLGADGSEIAWRDVDAGSGLAEDDAPSVPLPSDQEFVCWLIEETDDPYTFSSSVNDILTLKAKVNAVVPTVPDQPQAPVVPSTPDIPTVPTGSGSPAAPSSPAGSGTMLDPGSLTGGFASTLVMGGTTPSGTGASDGGAGTGPFDAGRADIDSVEDAVNPLASAQGLNAQTAGAALEGAASDAVAAGASAATPWWLIIPSSLMMLVAGLAGGTVIGRRTRQEESSE